MTGRGPCFFMRLSINERNNASPCRYEFLWVLLQCCCPWLFHQVVVYVGSREETIFCSLHRLCPTDNARTQIEGADSVVIYKGNFLICHVDML